MVHTIMRLSVLLILLLQCSIASAWTKADTAYELAYQAIAVLDWQQTHDIREKGHIELNPLLGAYPTSGTVDKYFITTGLLHAGLSVLLKGKYRRGFQIGTIAVESGVVLRNISMGYSIRF